jgi:hypothetical protein
MRQQFCESGPWQTGIQRPQVRRKEQAIFANQLTIEPDFATTIVGPLDKDQIPVDATSVAVVGFVVSVSGREME